MAKFIIMIILVSTEILSELCKHHAFTELKKSVFLTVGFLEL